MLIVKFLKTSGSVKKLNNFISKIFTLVFRSDRFACIASIKEKGYDEYAKEMAEKEIMSIKK